MNGTKRKIIRSSNRTKVGRTRPSGLSTTACNAHSTNQPTASPRCSSTPGRGPNSINERPNDTDRANDMATLDDSQYDLRHVFQESYPDPNADSMDSLRLFPIDVRQLSESDFFFPPWIQESPSSNEELPLLIPARPPSQYPTPEMTPSNPCQCTTQVLSLLEAIVHHDTLGTLASVPADLSLNKRALVCCKKLLDCHQCSSNSSFVTLLILLCQQITTSYENIIGKLCEQFNEVHPDHQFTARGDDLSYLQAPAQERVREQTCNEGNILNGLTPDKRLPFKDYEVDVEEKPCVFGDLTSMQLKTLVLFLVNLRELARGWSWGTHVLMVDAVERRVFALLSITNSCGGGVEVD
jgi:hypothetical protein